MKPFLKWAGNKYQIISAICERLPAGKRLIEPFVGSGAVFLNTQYPEPALLSDINPDLIQLFQVLQAEGETFIDYAASFFTPDNNDQATFYALRQQFNATPDPWLKSALFIYLNRHGYNGLCRYNSQGGFNVPFGRYTKPYFPRVEMRYFHDKAQAGVFQVLDYETAMQAAEPGDIVYCDPPYVPLTATAKFTSYSGNRFGQIEQERLAHLAYTLAERGVHVLISNHDTPFTQSAYATADITALQVQRYISAKAHTRQKANELLALFS